MDRFFNHVEDKYRINKSIRDMIVFAPQNVVEEPPFSNMDLVSCRNLLIYITQEQQNKLIPLLDYSLKSRGYLFLGTSESVGEFTDLFEPVNRRMKLFKSKKATKKLPTGLSWIEVPEKDDLSKTTIPRRETSFSEQAREAILEHHTPPIVIIDREGTVKYVHGDTGKYLQPAKGEANLNIITMAREGLEDVLTVAIRKVVNQNESVSYPNLRVKAHGDISVVNLEVEPIKRPDSIHDLIMVVFKDVTPPEGMEIQAEGSDIIDKDQRIELLEDELKSKEEYIQTTIEELQTSNEELLSTNEELHTANEELETSQEELRSLNEALQAVNQEHEETIEELKRAYSDIKNLQNVIRIGILFVDRDLIIKNFTPSTKMVFNLIHSDVGRSIKDISTKLKYDDLVQDMNDVLDSLIPKETEAQTKEGYWFLVRIFPYRTINDVIEGVAVTFIDITERKRTEEKLRRMATVIRDSNDAITVHDLQGNITHWNWGAESMYGYTESEALKMNIQDLVTKDKRKESLHYIEEIKKGEPVESFETQRVTKEGKVLDVWLTVTKLVDDSGNPVAVSTTERDITERKQKEEELRRMATVIRDSNDAIAVHDFQGNITHWNRGAEKMYGFNELEALKMNIRDILPEDNRREALDYIEKIKNGELTESFETQRRTKDGKILDVWLTLSELVDDDGEPLGVATTERDITERKQKERELSKLAAALSNARDAITIQDMEGTVIEWNWGAEKMYGYDKKEMVGKSFSQLVPDEKQEEFNKFLSQIRSGQLVERRQTQRLTKDGEVLEVELTVSPIKEDGKLTSIATIERIIDERGGKDD